MILLFESEKKSTNKLTMHYERDCILCPMNERRLKHLAVVFSLMSTAVVLVHVMIFTVTSVANGCICGFAGCPATPLALFGQGLWCGAFGFIAATLAIFASHSTRKSFKCLFTQVLNMGHMSLEKYCRRHNGPKALT